MECDCESGGGSTRNERRWLYNILDRHMVEPDIHKVLHIVKLHDLSKQDIFEKKLQFWLNHKLELKIASKLVFVLQLEKNKRNCAIL